MNAIDNQKAYHSIETYLKNEGNLTYSFKGVSMLPILRQKSDLYTLKKKGEERLKKYDVALYRLEKGGHTYVLHRIIDVLEDGYIFLGDNCITTEKVREDQVLGVMTSFYRGPGGLFGNRTIDVNHPLYLAYSRCRVLAFPLRRCYRINRSRAARVYRHFFPKKQNQKG